MSVIGRAAAALALIVGATVHPVAAQDVAPQACADIKELIRYLLNEGAFVQDAGLKEGVDLLAQDKVLRNALCGTPGDDSLPAPTAPEPQPTGAPAPTPVFRPADPIPTPDISTTRRDACLLVTATEVSDAMKLSVAPSEADPAGAEGVAQGCEFSGGGSAYADIMYFQTGAVFVYDAFHSTADGNGVQDVPGLGERAFTYVGGNGPGVVVAKGDKLFTIEFSGIGDGPSERSSLVALAQKAVARVH